MTREELHDLAETIPDEPSRLALRYLLNRVHTLETELERLEDVVSEVDREQIEIALIWE